jgi:hypothetical protein
MMPKPVLTFVHVDASERAYWCEGLVYKGIACSTLHGTGPEAVWRRINPITGEGDFVCERHLHEPHMERHGMRKYLTGGDHA